MNLANRFFKTSEVQKLISKRVTNKQREKKQNCKIVQKKIILQYWRMGNLHGNFKNLEM